MMHILHVICPIIANKVSLKGKKNTKSSWGKGICFVPNKYM